MIRVDTAAGLQWKWRQPQAFKRFYEMTTDGSVVCTLHFAVFGSLATAESAHGSWTLKRCGVLTPRITVRKAGEIADLAVFSPKWTGGGQLRFTGGASYAFKCQSFWRGDWAFENPRGEVVLSLRAPHCFLKNNAEIVLNAAGDPAELTLLAALAWYLHLLMIEDAAVTVAVIG